MSGLEWFAFLIRWLAAVYFTLPVFVGVSNDSYRYLYKVQHLSHSATTRSVCITNVDKTDHTYFILRKWSLSNELSITNWTLECETNQIMKYAAKFSNWRKVQSIARTLLFVISIVALNRPARWWRSRETSAANLLYITPCFYIQIEKLWNITKYRTF